MLFQTVWGFCAGSLEKKKDLQSNTVEKLRWKRFKSQHLGDRQNPPTSGAWYQHILRAHMQDYVWSQDLVENPNIPDPFKLDGCMMQVNSILSDIAISSRVCGRAS